MDEKTFLSLGMNHKEAKLYKALFKLKEAPPTLLGKLIKEKRTTAYSIARGLAEKGFIIENTTKRPQTFTIVQADDIERVLEDDVLKKYDAVSAGGGSASRPRFFKCVMAAFVATR